MGHTASFEPAELQMAKYEFIDQDIWVYRKFCRLVKWNI